MKPNRFLVSWLPNSQIIPVVWVGEPKVELACMEASLDRPHVTLLIQVLLADVEEGGCL
jgi:hypothetical protein